MIMKKILGYLILPLVLLFSQGALAQDDDDDFLLDDEEIVEPKPVYTSEIEIGFGWQSQDSFKFGEFSGLTDRGAFIIGNLRISRRDAWDSGGAKYWTLTGTNLGLDSRFLGFEYGKQGKYKIFVSYDQTPKNLWGDAMTPFILQNSGTSLVLPAGWVPSDREVSQLTQLNSSLQPIQIAHERQKFSGGFAWNIDKQWTFTSEFTRETKQGNRTIAAIFGSSGGNFAGMVVPEPVDYETDNWNISLQYTGKKAQFALDYNLSNFRNNKPTLMFQNPFDASSYDADARFPDSFGLLATAPDNKASRVTFSGGYTFDNKTRGTINIVYNHSTQNDLFLPYTVNPNLVVTIPLPRSSLMGEINTFMANIGLRSRVGKRLTLGFDFRHENRDNETPIDVFIRVPNDSFDQGTLDSSQARLNIPYDRKQNKFKFDIGYKFSSDVKLAVAYIFEQLERTYSEVAKTKEHRVDAKLRFTPTTKTFGWFGIGFADRNGSGYEHNALFLLSHTPEFIEEEGEEFENHPLVRKFFIADRERFTLNGSFNWLPNDKVVVGLYGHYTKDDYNETFLGLLENKTASGTFDIAYTPNDVIGYYAYVTFESLEYDQASFTHRPGDDLDDFAARLWTANTHDKVTTFGVGFDWQAIKDKLKINADFTYSNADTEFFFTGGTSVSFLQIPDLNSKLIAIEVKFDYQYSNNLWIRGRYWFQDLNLTDWALDGVDPDTMRRIIGLGNQSPRYSVHIIGISTIYRF